MQVSLHNRIVASLIGLLCMTVGFFAPVSLSTTVQSNESPRITLVQNLSFAQMLPSGVGSAEGATNPVTGKTDDTKHGPSWMDQIGLFLGNMLLTVGSLVAFLGGMLLDLAITELILNMGKWLTQGGIGDVINETWSIVRDVVNLVFIFGFVYIGIMTILDPGRLNTRSLLVQLVIAALLINFSLFFTKIVVDVANVFAIEVNQLMERGEEGNIGATFASTMGISGFYKEMDPETLERMTDGGTPTFFIMGSIFLIITGFVFAAGAAMIAIRFVALIFIMIGSPLFFAGMAFPQAKKFTFDILGKLIGYAFYAPVFLFLIYVSLRIIGTSTFDGGTANQLADVMKADGAKPLDAYLIFLQFFIAIVLIIASLRIAKSFSMVGANAVVNTTEGALKRIAGRVGATPFGMAAGLGRSTIGRAGNYLSDREDLKDAASKKGIGGFMARRALNVTRGAANASYDARQVAGLGKKIGVGEGSKKGFKEQREDLEKNRMKFAESLGEVKDDDKKIEEWQGKIDAETDAVQDLKDLISAEKDPEKKNDLQGQLRYREFMLRNYEEAHKYEKNRRQIGSADANNVMANMNTYTRQQLAQQFKEVAAARTPAEKATARNTLRTMIANTREYQKKNASPVSERGYAGALESSKVLNFFRDGHIIPAGEAVRKNYNKKFKRTKEDERTERMVDTFKSSK